MQMINTRISILRSVASVALLICGFKIQLLSRNLKSPSTETAVNVSQSTTATLSLSHQTDRMTGMYKQPSISDYTDRYRSRIRSSTASPSPAPIQSSSTESSDAWRAGFNRVQQKSFSDTWNFYGWWKVQPWNGGSRKPVQNYTADMQLYPGTNGGRKSGNINVIIFDNLDLQFDLQVTNAGKDCTLRGAAIGNVCNVIIHEGSSCDSPQDIGDPFYDSSKIGWTSGSPFTNSYYVSDSVGLSNSLVELYNGGNGYDTDTNDQRTIVLKDSSGEGVLCGIMSKVDPYITFPPITTTAPMPGVPAVVPNSGPTPNPLLGTPSPASIGQPQPLFVLPTPFPVLIGPPTPNPVVSPPFPVDPTPLPAGPTQPPNTGPTQPPNVGSQPPTPFPETPSPSPKGPMESEPTTAPYSIENPVPTLGPLVPATFVPTFGSTGTFVPTIGPPNTLVPTKGNPPTLVPVRRITVAPVAPFPTTPIAPVAPIPTAPIAPVAPIPTVPIAPVAPSPFTPIAPVAPTPTAPVAPVAPSPTAPVAPSAPTPTTPVAPAAPNPTVPRSPVAPNPTAPMVPAAPTPTAPVAPVAPNPTAPVAPSAPTPVAPAAPNPTVPISPVAPNPTAPMVPVAPSPSTPIAPVAPSPTAPVAPSAPTPTAPVAPAAPNPTVPISPVAPNPIVPVAPNAPKAPVVPAPNNTAPVLPLAKPKENAVSMKVSYKGYGWIGIGNSTNGKMTGAGAVIGIPNGQNSTNVLKYSLTSRDLPGVNNLTLNQQDLQNAYIIQAANETTLFFIWPLPDAVLQGGVVPLIWAYGETNTLAYHKNKGGGTILGTPFILDFKKCFNGTNSTLPACKPNDSNYDQINVLDSPATNILTLHSKLVYVPVVTN